MNKLKPQTTTNPFIFFISIIIFFFLIHHSFSIDPWYESCIPMDCGDGVNITYPFFINGLQNSSCGYPGFNLTCINNNSILQISGNNFTVQHIDQKTQRIRLQNPKISSNSNEFDHCPLKISNLTLDPTRFTIDDETTTKLLVISNCSGGVSPELERYRIEGCGGRSEFVVAVGDRKLGEVVAGCGGGGVVVETPVEVGGGDGRRVVVDGGNFGEVGGRGFWMRWRAADCGGCERSGGRCGFNSSEFKSVCFCTDRPHKVSCKDENSNRMLIIILVMVGSAVIFALATSIFFIRRAYKRRDIKYADKSQELEDTNVYFGVSVFSYAELQDATNHFNSSRELGDGGFGTVYYGKLRDGREVAVKRLYEHNYKRVQQFMNEVEILTRLRHINLVSLYGCTSRRSRELLLVYEYIPNGTVADHLHGDRAKQSPLMWPTRMKIAIETANALVYLHASEIIHRDVKTNNILLDNNYCVKVADFGLSRLLPSDVTHVSTAPQGTPGYVDPEYHQCFQLTDKSDVYSFGVVLVELISSMPAIDISRSREEIVLANMAINRIQKRALDELIDPFLVSNMDTKKMINSMAELAFRCLQFESESRPTMNEVLEVLKAIQGEESGDDTAEVIVGEPELPLASPENDSVRLLKGRITASPISVTTKWHSSSSGSITTNADMSS